jgi:hypothetical protein
MKFLLKLVRNGNSTMVTVPRELLDALQLHAGGVVIATLHDERTMAIRKLEIAGPVSVSRGGIPVTDPVAVER